MSTDAKKRGCRGFTLVEVLVVMVIMGVVTTAIFTLYTSTDKTANTSEEIVEVQQNLRIALDQIARDLRMAGFLIPNGQTPLISAPERSTDNNNDRDCVDSGELPGSGAGCFSFRTATLSGRVARIIGTPGGASPADESSAFLCTVGSAEMVDLFESGSKGNGDWVRIIRPADGRSPLNRILWVSSRDRGDPSLTLKGFTAATVYRAGDLIVRVSDANDDNDGDANTNPPPAVITSTYRLIDDPESTDPSMRILVRRESTGADIQTHGTDVPIAGKVTDLRFSYILEDGSETSSVTDADRLGEVTAIRVMIAGATDVTRTGNPRYSGIKTRTVESVIKLRNR